MFYAICEQQRCRSTCASAQSDQHLCFRCLDSRIPLFAIADISSLKLASVAAQAGLCLTWSQILKTDFLVTRQVISWLLEWSWQYYWFCHRHCVADICRIGAVLGKRPQKCQHTLGTTTSHAKQPAAWQLQHICTCSQSALTFCRKYLVPFLELVFPWKTAAPEEVFLVGWGRGRKGRGISSTHYHPSSSSLLLEKPESSPASYHTFLAHL